MWIQGSSIISWMSLTDSFEIFTITVINLASCRTCALLHILKVVYTFHPLLPCMSLYPIHFSKPCLEWIRELRLHLILALGGNVVVIECVLQVLKCGSVLWFFSPTCQHYFVEFFRTVIWTWHSVHLVQVTNHLWIRHSYGKAQAILYIRIFYKIIKNHSRLHVTWIRHSSIGYYLGHENAKGPDIWFDAKCSKIDRLWSCPLNWKLCP